MLRLLNIAMLVLVSGVMLGGVRGGMSDGSVSGVEDGRMEEAQPSSHTLPPSAPEAPPELVPAIPEPRVMLMEVTAYCPCEKCCGAWADGITASGRPVTYNNGRFVAADTRLLPFGTKLEIPGYASAEPVKVLDRGGAIKGHRLDVFFPTHQEALQWGRQKLMVTVIE